MNKKELRRQMILRRDSLSERERMEQSQQVMEKIWCLESVQRADTILSYCSFRSEVSTEKINERILAEGKRLYLPKTYPDKHEMKFYQVMGRADLIRGYQGIMEPKEGEALFEKEGSSLGRIVMLMPGVAYDEKGNRLGYGGGYYDRYLAEFGKELDEVCMLAFDVQQTKQIEVELSDVRPDRIVTGGRHGT